MTFHLKRFEQGSDWISKVDLSIRYPYRLDLAPYLSEEASIS